MQPITLRVLDGADRGRVYDMLHAPITIGREEGNSVQLNDERVSRFHVKIQEDHEKLVLTDLESTNGTKVNGEDIQLRILRFGDMISVGRSVLLFGSRDQISSRMSRIREEAASHADGPSLSSAAGNGSGDFQLHVPPVNDSDWQAKIFDYDPPELPARLSPGQAAQLSEVLEYLHLRLRNFTSSVDVDRKAEHISLHYQQWQNLLDLHARLSEYLRQIGFPGEPDS